MTEPTTCPTCGSPVHVVSGDEGTSHYEPVRESAGAGLLDELRAALWQCGIESGMDTDGDGGPGAMIAGMGDAGFAAAMVDQVRQLRCAYDEVLGESGTQSEWLRDHYTEGMETPPMTDQTPAEPQALSAALTKLLYETDGTADHLLEVAPLYGVHIALRAASPENAGAGQATRLLGAVGFMAADRALAVAHREDDQPCGCDECMAYGAEDEGFDWYKVTPPRRIVLRALDSGDERLAPLVVAFREHEAAFRESAGAGLDVLDVAIAMQIIDERHHDPEHGRYKDQWRDPKYWEDDAAELAAEYARLAAADKPSPEAAPGDSGPVREYGPYAGMGLSDGSATDWHVFRDLDPEAECPTCHFPAWSHDPAQAVLYSRRVASPAAPEPREGLDVERLYQALRLFYAGGAVFRSTAEGIATHYARLAAAYLPVAEEETK